MFLGESDLDMNVLFFINPPDVTKFQIRLINTGMMVNNWIRICNRGFIPMLKNIPVVG